ncbi:cytochrome P450 [Cladochytrium replicatum]|nr:cytochrome P450 [Cladochytrium replicatum]
MLLALILVTSLLVAFWHLLYQQLPDSLPGPYLTRLPVLCSVLEVSYYAVVHSRADLFFDYVARRFGSFARVWFPAVGRGIVVTDAVAIQKMLTLSGGSEGRMFARSEYVPVMAKDMTEYAMSTLPENTLIWKKHRKVISPAFSPSYLRRAHSFAQDASTKLMSKWLHRFNAVQVDQTSFVVVESHDLLTIVLELTTRTIGNLERAIDMKNANSSSDETPLETKSRFDTSLDLLDRLLQVPTAENDEDPDGLTEAEIRGAQIGLLLGSLDTSFGTLQLALLELSSMPDLQAGLASEIVDINALSFDDIPSFIPFIPRTATHDILHPGTMARRRLVESAIFWVWRWGN